MVPFMAFADAYGKSWFKEFGEAAELARIRTVANEHFARTDESRS
jgi:branched-chain amino acid transport system substrate-binding protein